ncbi:MAG: CHASE2 domain-containing protein, partial [Alphaproteobacteria bacterium]|nr:CHASE2 domain-containing protein [Alphaproteobacteria bacterium]
MRIRGLFGGIRLRAPVLVSLAILIGALALRIVDPPALGLLRDYAFDQYQRLKPRPYAADLPVRIIDIDEASLRELGQGPGPRAIMARLVEKLVEKGAAVIAFDVVFAEPDRASIAVALRDLPPGPNSEALAKLVEGL